MSSRQVDTIWEIVKQQVRVFNSRTANDVSDLYQVPSQPTPSSLERMKKDLDSLVISHSLDEDEELEDFYMHLREQIEILCETVEDETEYRES